MVKFQAKIGLIIYMPKHNSMSESYINGKKEIVRF